MSVRDLTLNPDFPLEHVGPPRTSSLIAKPSSLQRRKTREQCTGAIDSQLTVPMPVRIFGINDYELLPLWVGINRTYPE